jgi:hypothetical protein
MPSLDTAVIVLAGIALFAAFVNGAIGYGFSSLTVVVSVTTVSGPPLAILFNNQGLVKTEFRAAR